MIRILLICLFSLVSSPGLLFAREVVFYHTDNVGSPVAMTNSDGAVVWRAHDKPFGEEFQTTATPEHSSRRFIGKEKDKETGLVYIGARYLDPITGRFLQPDPIGPVDPMTGKVNVEMLTNPQRLNRYAYGLNNPYRYIDPDGESPIIVGAIGAVVGAAYNGAGNWNELSGGNWWRSVSVGAGAGFIAGATGGLGGAIVGSGLNEIHDQTLRGKDITNYDSKSIGTAATAGGAAFFAGKFVVGVGKEIPQGGLGFKPATLLHPIDLQTKTYQKAGSILAVPVSSETERHTKEYLDN